MYIELNMSIDAVSQSHNLNVTLTNEQYKTEADSAVRKLRKGKGYLS